jgi:hypothetical protein
MDRDNSEKLKLFVDALTSTGIDARAAQPYASEHAPAKICMVGCGDEDRARLTAAFELAGISNYVTFITLEEAAKRDSAMTELMLQLGGFVQHVPEIGVALSLKDLPCMDTYDLPTKKKPQDRFSFIDGVGGFSRRGRARNQNFSQHFKHG